MKVLKRNIFLLVFFLIMIICLLKKDNYLPAEVVSSPDSQVLFTTEHKMLEQTWQSNVKKIAGVSIPYTSADDFSSDMRMEFVSDDGEEILAQASASYDFVKDGEGMIEFAVKPFGVEPGTRYRIRMYFDDPSGQGGLLLRAGSEYMGGSIDGVSCECAVAFSITFVKNSRLFWLFITYFPFLSFALLLMVIWQRKWEDTIGLAVIVPGFIMYFAGLAGKLESGIAVVYALAMISFVISIVLYNKKDLTIKALWSPGLFAFGIAIFIILINCNGMWLARYDEYSHWGLAAKDMFYYNSLSKHIGTTVMLQRYPPFITIMEYFFTYTNGMFSQSILYVGFQTVAVSLLIIVCKTMDGERRGILKYLAPALTVILLIPVIFFYDVYNCLYVDPLLAFFMAYVLICYYSERMSLFNFLRIAGGLFALTTTKETGVVFAGLTTLIMLADTLYRQYREKRFKLKELLIPCFCTVMVCALFFGWEIYLSIPAKEPVVSDETVSEGMGNDAEEILLSASAQEPVSLLLAAAGDESAVSEEDDSAIESEDQKKGEKITAEKKGASVTGAIGASGITWKGLWNFITHRGPEYQYKTWQYFVEVVFEAEMWSVGFVKLPYADLFILLLMICWAISHFPFWEDEDKRFLSFAIFSTLAGICYAGFILVTYLFAFSETEAVSLHSIERYLGSFIAGTLITFCVLFIMQVAKLKAIEKRQKAWYTVMLACAVILIGTPMHFFVYGNRDKNVTRGWYELYDHTSEICRSFMDKSESMGFVAYNSNSLDAVMIRNAVSPAKVKEAGIEKNNVSLEEWRNDLQNCDYVLIVHSGGEFKTTYGSLFEEPERISDGTYYRVVQTESGIRLQYMGDTGLFVFG